jgi:hypothetical protein
MVAPSKLVKITPEATADDLLDDADREPVIVERNGVRYYVTREVESSDIWTGYDPERAFRALDAIVGIFDDVDTDAWIADIYDAREKGSRPIDGR